MSKYYSSSIAFGANQTKTEKIVVSPTKIGDVTTDAVSGALTVDEVPTLNSLNPVSSGGVKEAISEAIADIPSIEAVIPEGASEENQLVKSSDLNAVDGRLENVESKIPSSASSTDKLVTKSELDNAIDNATASMESGYTPKGPASVSALNALTDQENGDQYIVTDSGTLTAGSIAVTAGESVAWDSTNATWYKVNQYALKSVQDELEAAVDSVTPKEYRDTTTVETYTTLEQGTWAHGEKENSDYFIRYGEPIDLTVGNSYSLSVAPGYLCGVQFLDSEESYVDYIPVRNTINFTTQYPKIVIYVSKINYTEDAILPSESTDASLTLRNAEIVEERAIGVGEYEKDVPKKYENFENSTLPDKVVALEQAARGKIKASNGSIVNDSNWVYTRIDVEDYSCIACRMPASTEYGLAFFDANGTYRRGATGFADGSKEAIFRIPPGISYLLYSYYSDTYAERVAYPKSSVVRLMKNPATYLGARTTNNGYVFVDYADQFGTVTANLVQSTEYEVPEGSAFVKYPAMKVATGVNLGLVFFDASWSYISGYRNERHDDGTTLCVPVPANARHVVHTYWTDRYLQNAGITATPRALEFVGNDGTETLIFDAEASGINGVPSSVDGSIRDDTTNYWYMDIPIPEGYNSVNYMTFKTSYVYGVCFLDGSKRYISGNASNYINSGSKVSREIPNGAKYFRYSYAYDDYADDHSWPRYDGRVIFEKLKMGLPTTSKHTFKVKVNINIRTYDATSSMDVMDSYVEGEDWGFIQLPPTYKATGKPTRLLIACHGASVNRDQYKSEVYHNWSQTYWNRMGYAIMDMFAAPEELTASSEMHYGNPTVLECYRKGYEYVVKNFNVYPEVIVQGSSMGGLSSFQIVDSGMFPVVCQIANCPCIDLYKQAYVNPWTTPTYQRSKIAEYFNFSGTAPTFTTSKPPTAEEMQYFIDNFDKVIGFYPIIKNVVSGDISKVLEQVPEDVATTDAPAEKALYDTLTATHPCPLIVFHCEDDPTVAWRYSKYWVEMIRRSGQTVYFHSFPEGRHAAWDAGDTTTTTDVNGNSITLSASKYEAYLFAKRFAEP